MKAYQNIPSLRILLLVLLGDVVAVLGANTTTTSTAPTPTSTAFSGLGTLRPIVFPSSQEGCLLNNGLWSIAGTCGTYTATNSGSSFTLSTSSGNCEVLSGLFTCRSGATSTTFTEVNGFLAFNGNNLFTADVVPSGQNEETINAGVGPNNVIDLTVQWQST